MNVEKAVSRNPFWSIIRSELPKNGFKQFHPEQAGNHSFVVVIEGLNNQGLPHKQKYHFPKIGRSFESTLNFKSSFRNFVKQELPNRGFFPAADHRVRQPGMFIAKINHDVEKKQLVTPKPMLQALAEMRSDEIDVAVPPYIPEEKPAFVPMVNKVHSNEPVSDSMVLAVFLLDARELSTMIDVCSGVAKFRGSRPAPLRILAKAAPPAPVAEPEQQVAKQPPARDDIGKLSVIEVPKHLKSANGKPVKRISVQDAIVQRMCTKVKKVWTPSDFEDLVRAKNSLSANLSMLTTSKRVRRVGTGQYMIK